MNPYLLSERSSLGIVAAVLSLTIILTSYSLLRPAGASTTELAARANHRATTAVRIPLGLRDLELPRWQSDFFDYDGNAKRLSMEFEGRGVAALV